MKKAFDDSFMPPPPPKHQSSTEVLPTVIPASDITVLPKTTLATTPSKMPTSMNGKLEIPVHKINPVVGIASEISNIIGHVTSCISAISVEKQRTAQVHAQADAFKTQQYEMTNKVYEGERIVAQEVIPISIR